MLIQLLTCVCYLFFTQLIPVLTSPKMFRAVKSADDDRDRTSTIFQFSSTAPVPTFPKAPIYFHYLHTKKSEPDGPRGASINWAALKYCVSVLCVRLLYICEHSLHVRVRVGVCAGMSIDTRNLSTNRISVSSRPASLWRNRNQWRCLFCRQQYHMAARYLEENTSACAKHALQ